MWKNERNGNVSLESLEKSSISFRFHFFVEMTFLFVLLSRQCAGLWVLSLLAVAQSTRTGLIHIKEGDPNDMTLYKGPTNSHRPGGKPLPSYVLRAKSDPDFEDESGLYGYVGSKKPVWNDDEEAAKFNPGSDDIQGLELIKNIFFSIN